MSDSLIINIKTANSSHLKVVNLYVGPETKLIKAKIVSLFENNSTIITGDINAKSRLWGKTENAQGRVFEDLLGGSNYVAANDGQPIRLDERGTESAIDLTVVSRLPQSMSRPM